MARKAPHERKALSYARDRRNVYGESDKGSRRIIRLHKRVPNRADRHRERQALATAAGSGITAEIAERAETKLNATRSTWLSKRWRKVPDAPLADVIETKLGRRVSLGMFDSATADAKVDRIRRHTRKR